MSGNTFGALFRVTTFGESHGPVIGCVIDGCPPGLPLAAADIQTDLDRRKPGTSRHVTQRRETDEVEILSGVFDAETTGAPIAFLIHNRDQRSRDYGNIADAFRPGHADYAWWQKYGVRDYRGGGRASARETAARVAAGAVARKWLAERFGIVIRGYLAQLGDLPIAFESWDEVDRNPFFAPNAEVVPGLEARLDELRRAGDSSGARINIVAGNMPVGWGEPVFDRLDADIAHAMMSINAVKGIEIGAGFAAVSQSGSQHGDELTPDGFLSNHAGGVLGGVSTGQDILVSLAVKPTPSIRIARRTIDRAGAPMTIGTEGRHDPCVGIRAVPVAEAMLALTLIDHALRWRAQCGDVHTITPHIAGLSPEGWQTTPPPRRK
ncbi:MAG: chorismate synthase [Azoarcus sp.]|jgi:chorismate synthase|nr:chorismate synthase [Azoarcus sp.]